MSYTHHALLVRSDAVLSFVVPASDDAVEQRDTYTERLGIDDARTLIEQAYTKPQYHAVKLLIVRTEFITHEAQNALLKVLEEPPETTRFYFVVPPAFTILPTLASRLFEQSVANTSAAASDSFAAFLDAGYADRLSQIEQAAKRKDHRWYQQIRNGLVAHLKEQSHTTAQYAGLEYVARLLLTRGASNKMLLEQAALLL